MRIRVFGSAAGGGLPQWNCGCRNCSEARQGRLPIRLSAAVGVSGDEDHWVVVNAGCDISRQLAAANDLHPAGRRANPIAALLLTDANIDHTAGALEFRQADSFRIHSTGLVKRTLCAAAMFSPLARGNRQWLTFEAASGRVRLDVPELGDMGVWAIAVPGLLPSYAGGQERAGATVAYVFEHLGARFVYAPVFLALDNNLLRELDRADAVLLDGTCWSDDEMIEQGLSTRTSRAMGHAPIYGSDGSLNAVSTLRAQQRYYTHVNNSNPILNPASEQSDMLRRAGIAVAHDGLEIVLDGSRN